MSTIAPTQTPPGPPAAPPGSIPPLHNGDRMTREEFHRRYEAMPHVKKAELIEGVVYMPSPVRHDAHSYPNSDMITWLGFYLPVSADGFLKSESFPGLWLDPQALMAGDLFRLFEVVQSGVRTPEHTAFVQELERRRATGA